MCREASHFVMHRPDGVTPLSARKSIKFFISFKLIFPLMLSLHVITMLNYFLIVFHTGSHTAVKSYRERSHTLAPAYLNGHISHNQRTTSLTESGLKHSIPRISCADLGGPHSSLSFSCLNLLSICNAVISRMSNKHIAEHVTF